MKENISYHWGHDHLLIKLGNRIQPRIRVLFWSEFVLTLGMATIFMMKAMPAGTSLVNWLACLGASVLYLLAAYRFFSRMYYNETIVLDPEYITIINGTPFTQKIRRYEWEDIGPLHYVGKSSKTDHPLKGNCYDYFGFETQEQLIQNLHQNGNLYFNYAGFSVRFARAVYSWDAEEMVGLMKIYAGKRLRLGPEWKQMEHESWHSQDDDISIL